MYGGPSGDMCRRVSSQPSVLLVYDFLLFYMNSPGAFADLACLFRHNSYRPEGYVCYSKFPDSFALGNPWAEVVAGSDAFTLVHDRPLPPPFALPFFSSRSRHWPTAIVIGYHA